MIGSNSVPRFVDGAGRRAHACQVSDWGTDHYFHIRRVSTCSFLEEGVQDNAILQCEELAARLGELSGATTQRIVESNNEMELSRINMQRNFFGTLAYINQSLTRSVLRNLAGLMVVAAGLTLPVAGQAQYTYTTNNNTITITGYTGPGGLLVIPNTLSGLPVASIGTNAFQSNTNLTSVTIPNTVTNIDGHAFYACTHLASITIPDTVTSLGSFVFGYCVSLTNVTIPPAITNLGVEAFYDCYHLPSIVIPPNVTSLGVNSFSYCHNLASITIPASVTNIGLDAFTECASLTNITVDPQNPAYSSLAGVLFDKNQTTLIQCPGGLAGTTVIPATVTNIISAAFESCNNLTGVTIGSHVTSIGFFAFDNCTSLTNLTIPSSVTSIAGYAFYDCINLSGVYFQGNAPSGVNVSSVFSNDNHATVYYLPGATGFGATIGGRTTALWQGTVTTATSPASGGSASGGGTYAVGTNVQMVATPNSGWTFTGWSDGNSHNPRTISVAGGGTTYTANFMNAAGGSIATPMFAGTNGLYDLTGILTNLSADFSSGSSTTTISEAVVVLQSTTGALTGSGTTTATVVTSGGEFAFPATYKLKGSVKSAGAKVVFANAFTGKGSSVLEGVTYKFSEVLTDLVTLDPATGTLTGRITGTASATGKGPDAGTSKILSPTFGPEASPFAPVTWQLSLALTFSGTKATGTAAVDLANGRTFPFLVKGTIKKGDAKLTLTGTGDGKGAKLTVTLAGPTITGISGSLLGQKVNPSGF